MIIVNTVEEFVNILTCSKHLKIYGARYGMYKILEAIKQVGFSVDIIEMILVSDFEGTPLKVDNIPVELYKEEKITAEDVIILAVPLDVIEEVRDRLEDANAQVCSISQRLMGQLVTHSVMYFDVYSMIKQIFNTFDIQRSLYNHPVHNEKKIVWTCWWQGIENAPEIVKMCLESQRKNLSDDIEMILITETNYLDYIWLPAYILEKVECGFITITTLSDIIRSCLLYKYGGIWIDATVMMHQSFPKEFFELELYSCKGSNGLLKSYSKFSLWCMGGKAGNVLYKFLMEAFFFYFEINDRIKYYLTIDYLIEIAKNYFSDVKKQYEIIPYNNERAGQLVLHLEESFCDEKYLEYVKDTCLQKLTWKIRNKYGKDVGEFAADTVYAFLLEKYLRLGEGEEK